MNTVIREALAEDLPAILSIVNDAIVNTTAIYDYNPRTLEQQLGWFDDKKKSGFPVIVAETGGAVVGFGAYGTFRVRDAYRFTVEHSVYVTPGLIGKGIGAALLLELISLARKAGMHTMIGGIDSSNTSSIVFHEKFGFQQAGIIRQAGFKFDRWLDLTFMQLML